MQAVGHGVKGGSEDVEVHGRAEASKQVQHVNRAKNVERREAREQHKAIIHGELGGRIAAVAVAAVDAVAAGAVKGGCG